MRIVLQKIDDVKVCRYYFGKDYVYFHLYESGEITVTSNKVQLMNIYSEQDKLKLVIDTLDKQVA